jgi:hypothetical protein
MHAEVIVLVTKESNSSQNGKKFSRKVRQARQERPYPWFLKPGFKIVFASFASFARDAFWFCF